MNTIRKAIGAIGRLILVLLGGIAFPVLIWVALVIAMGQKLKARKARLAPALPGEITTASLPSAEPAPGYCWEALGCPAEKRDACPSFVHRDVACWGTGADLSRPITDECAEGLLLSLGGAPVPVRRKLGRV